MTLTCHTCGLEFSRPKSAVMINKLAGYNNYCKRSCQKPRAKRVTKPRVEPARTHTILKFADFPGPSLADRVRQIDNVLMNMEVRY